MTEKLVILNAQLAFALDDPAGIYDSANMLLIPRQRVHNGDSSLIDYTFIGEPVVLDTPVEKYDYENGFQLPRDRVTDLLAEARETMLEDYGTSGDWAREVDAILQGRQLPRWEVRTVFSDGSAENVWEADDQPQTFASEVEAKAALLDHLSAMDGAGMHYDFGDYVVRQVGSPT